MPRGERQLRRPPVEGPQAKTPHDLGERAGDVDRLDALRRRRRGRPRRHRTERRDEPVERQPERHRTNPQHGRRGVTQPHTVDGQHVRAQWDQGDELEQAHDAGVQATRPSERECGQAGSSPRAVAHRTPGQQHEPRQQRVRQDRRRRAASAHDVRVGDVRHRDGHPPRSGVGGGPVDEVAVQPPRTPRGHQEQEDAPHAHGEPRRHPRLEYSDHRRHRRDADIEARRAERWRVEPRESEARGGAPRREEDLRLGVRGEHGPVVREHHDDEEHGEGKEQLALACPPAPAEEGRDVLHGAPSTAAGII